MNAHTDQDGPAESERKRQFVTQQTCRDRHATTTWMFGILVGLMTVFLTGTIYAITSANHAVHKVSTVSTTLESHMAAQAEVKRHLMRRLDEIKADLREHRALLNEILKNGKTKK